MVTIQQKKTFDLPLYEYMEALAGKAFTLPASSVEYQSIITILSLVETCYQENGVKVRDAVRTYLSKRIFTSNEERTFFKRVNRELGQLPSC